jgi:hypothetical protein
MLEAERFMVQSDMQSSYASAMRLTACAAAIFPTDRELFESYHEAVLPDLMQLALSGRHVMEAYNVKDTVVCDWGFWPTSRAPELSSKNLYDTFSHILHSTRMSLGWEKFDGEIVAYRGRDCRYLGHVEMESDEGLEKFALGSVAASFLCDVTNKVNNRKSGAA